MKTSRTTKMTIDEAKNVLEKAKRELPSWEVVKNTAYPDEVVRKRVLFNLLKMFYRAAGSNADIMRRPEESFEEAIGRFVFRSTGGSWFPSRPEIDGVVETAFTHRMYRA